MIFFTKNIFIFVILVLLRILLAVIVGWRCDFTFDYVFSLIIK